MGVEADQQLSGVLKIGRTDLFEHTLLVLHDQQMRHCNGWEELAAKNSLPKAEERIRMRIIMKGDIHAKPNTRGLKPAQYQKE